MKKCLKKSLIHSLVQDTGFRGKMLTSSDVTAKTPLLTCLLCVVMVAAGAILWRGRRRGSYEELQEAVRGDLSIELT